MRSGRLGLSAIDQREIWSRWKAGETLSFQRVERWKKELVDHLRSKRRMRRSRHSSEQAHRRRQIVDAISIRERPAEAEDRAIPGHWEGDLLELVERTATLRP